MGIEEVKHARSKLKFSEIPDSLIIDYLKVKEKISNQSANGDAPEYDNTEIVKVAKYLAMLDAVNIVRRAINGKAEDYEMKADYIMSHEW